MDPAQQCVIFDNEFHQDCFRPIRPGESPTDYTTRLNWITAQWYRDHTHGKIGVILLTENEDVVLECSRRTPEKSDILVMGLPAYLESYHPQLTTVHQLYASLSASINSNKMVSAAAETPAPCLQDEEVAVGNLPQAPAAGDIYPVHLPEAALVAGIRSKQFLRGVLRVSRFRYSSEAIVVLTEYVNHQLTCTAFFIRHLSNLAYMLFIQLTSFRFF